MEHVTALWDWMKELYRILKVGGNICIIAPSTGKEHTEHDYWRIMPKGMKFILEWAGFENIEVTLNDNGKWKDVIGTARRKLYGL